MMAAALVLGGGLYIRLRWRRAPQAYRALIAVAVCYSAAGALLGLWLFHPAAASGSARRTASVPLADTHPDGDRVAARVIGITDGDTVTVLEADGRQDTIRLAGIDAPEHDQAFGAESTRHLAALLAGQTVALECGGERSYGRLVCKILLPDGGDACLDQIRAGLAWHYKQFQDEQSPADRAAYAAAECAAMKTQIGLWSDPRPVQPQDFRHGTNSPMRLDASGCRTSSEPSSGAVVGNARSHIFEWPGCPYYADISAANRVPFASPQAATAAGYRPARNCP